MNSDDKRVISLAQSEKKLLWKKQNFRKSVNMKKNIPNLGLKYRLWKRNKV